MRKGCSFEGNYYTESDKERGILTDNTSDKERGILTNKYTGST